VAKANAARRLQSDAPPRIQKTTFDVRTGEIATNLDRLLHDRMRLGIVSALAAGDELSFTDLKAALSATDGNLSVHARKLEEAVTCRARPSWDAPAHRLQIDRHRSPRVEKHLDHMDALIKAARRT
jgi:hypothetical protein